jgi:hypothetical protein
VKSSIEWREDAENAAPEERATVADWRVWLNEINVTQHIDDDVACDHVTVALYGLAHGLVHDWWTIFGSRDRDISLTRYRSGYLVPNLNFRFDGVAFEIVARQQVYKNPAVRFWAGPSEIMPREEGEAVLGDLIETVLSRLDAKGIRETDAHLRWRRVQASRGTSEALFCEAAGGLGLDPYEIDDETAAFVETAEGLFQGEALVDFVAGAANVSQSSLLDWVRRVLDDRGSQYRVPELENVVQDTVNASAQGRPEAWATGYRRARAMRSVLHINQAQKFASFRDIAKWLGAGANYNLAPRVDGIRALRSRRPDGPQIHLRNHGDSAEAQAQHLFAMARTLGDAACFPDQGLAPINDLHNAYRQAAGRAFAAEFLAPIDEIRSMLEDQHDLITIADAFAVSTNVIELQIENAERIDAACG